jgi:hypothetical protein
VFQRVRPPTTSGSSSPKTVAVREDTEYDTGTSDEGSNKDNVGDKPKGCDSPWTA